MKTKGGALILALFVILILGILSSSFLYKQINQSFLARRYTDSIRALWAAEAGLQSARNGNLSSSYVHGTLCGEGNFSATIDQIGTSDFYQVVSTGIVSGISRIIDAVVSIEPVDPTKFGFGLQASGPIRFSGHSTLWGENTTPNPPDQGTIDGNYSEEYSIFSFPDLFGFSSAEVKDFATVWTGDFPPAGFEGINWVDDPTTPFNGDINGTGILIINGTTRINGGIDFDGIIYVIGELFMAGTADVSGAILAEVGANLTKVTGTADIEHNTTDIRDALEWISFQSSTIVSWQERDVVP